MKNKINLLLEALDLKLVRNSTYERLSCSQETLKSHTLADLIDRQSLPQFFEWLPESRSQLRQDIFVLGELGFKHNGYFVEFGATNGIDLSNSYLLEKRFDWKGILAEPAKSWHKDLKKNRKAHIETDCVWTKSGETLVFNEVFDADRKAELSTIDTFSNSDLHSVVRRNGERYPVNTISLNDMLAKYEAPTHIDYLSIDTEGSEFDVLNAFDFRNYEIKIITCEHNFTPMREKVYKLLTSHGYERKFIEFSQFDDWYILR